MKLKYAREIKVGILAVVCIFLLFFGFNYLKGVNIFSSIHSFHGVYTNIHGLELQAPVYIRGYKVGQVDNIDYDFTRDSSFTVDISIKRNINLPEGTRMALVSDGIMGGMAIELLLPATEVASKEDIAYLPTGTTIPTTVVPGLLDGLQESVIQPLSNTLASLDTILGQLETQLDNNHIESILANADLAVADLQTSSQQLKQVMSHQVPSVVTKLDTTMSDLQQVVTDVKAANIKATVARVDTALDNVNYLIADFRSPNGTVGMLLNDKGLYNHIDSAVVSVDSLLVDLKANPKRYVHFSLFGAREKKKK
ncbi:MAG: MlaD family protein [Paludibacteraceae bacterium]|nr:MlaD family protein [Paludibacteraceae bacterium]